MLPSSSEVLLTSDREKETKQIETKLDSLAFSLIFQHP